MHAGEGRDELIPWTSELNPLRIRRVVRHVPLEHPPVVHDRRDAFLSVGAALDRYRVSAEHVRDLIAVRHQRDGRLVDLVLYLQAHARVAGHVLGPVLVVREGPLHAPPAGIGVDVELVATPDDADGDRVGDAIPRAGLEHDGVAALRVVEVVDEVPVRHHLADHLSREPQSGSGDAVCALELLAAGVQVLGLETHQAQREKREHDDADN